MVICAISRNFLLGFYETGKKFLIKKKTQQQRMICFEFPQMCFFTVFVYNRLGVNIDKQFSPNNTLSSLLELIGCLFC